jgi:hypothetical protein
MFERFTDHARHAIVLAQEEARGERLRHNYIGTEHLLLGLLGEPRGRGAQVLGGLGMTLDGTRDDVRTRVGAGDGPAITGHIPFTPRAKKVLEFALREADQLNDHYIGTEHVLLGLVQEGNGAGAGILAARCGSLDAVRAAVLKALKPMTPPAERRPWQSRPVSPRPGPGAEPGQLHTTPAADTGLNEAARLAGGEPVGSHHLVLAALGDPGTAAARALAALGVDLDQARAALRTADVIGSTDELPQEAGRRQMQLRATGDTLTIELRDPLIVELGGAALSALGERAGQPPVIRGDRPASASLAAVWLALRASLDEIRQHAADEPAGAPPGDTPAAEAPPGQAPQRETPAAGS